MSVWSLSIALSLRHYEWRPWGSIRVGVCVVRTQVGNVNSLNQASARAASSFKGHPLMFD